MAEMKTILPKGDYKIKTVGPSREWSFDGNDGQKVAMATDSLQLEGHEQHWVDLNRPAKNDPPKVGDTITGTVEQDVNAKYAPKFTKEKGAGGGGWRGGSAQASPGAIQAQNVATATAIVNGYYASEKVEHPASLKAYFETIAKLAPRVGTLVDQLVSKAKPAETKPDDTNSEAGETPAKPADKSAEISEDDLKLGDEDDW